MNEASEADVSRNLAWFKLSEFISRKEKERAFGVYKVLMLAFESKEYCLLVEGDLHAVFEEYNEAFNKYFEAAKLYEEKKDLFLTTVAYEAIVKVYNKLQFWQKLLNFYNQIGYIPKIALALKNIFYLALEEKKNNLAEETLKELKKVEKYCIDEEEALALYKLQENNHKKEALESIGKILEEHFVKGDSKALQKFLAKLETLDKDAYDNALSKMKDNKVE